MLRRFRERRGEGAQKLDVRVGASLRFKRGDRSLDITDRNAPLRHLRLEFRDTAFVAPVLRVQIEFRARPDGSDRKRRRLNLLAGPVRIRLSLELRKRLWREQGHRRKRENGAGRKRHLCFLSRVMIRSGLRPIKPSKFTSASSTHVRRRQAAKLTDLCANAKKGCDAMTRLLASVANAAEAGIVLQLGADIIDLKDPRRGALGAVSLDSARQAIAAVGGRSETSAALGDPPYNEDTLLESARALAAMGVDTVKLAVDAPTLHRLGDSLSELARDVALVGMMFADEKPDFALLAKLKKLGFAGAMLDTRDKTRGRLIAHLEVVKLNQFCFECRALNLMSGLAGSLEAPDVPRVLLVRPDILGFRGSLCNAHDRRGAIDPAAVALIRDLIPCENPDPHASPKIDWRLLARGIIGGRDDEGELDRVFVRDFVMPAEIGAYDFERGVRQRVAFEVDALVRRAGAHAEDMRSIFSYDLIIDAIRLVVGRGHVDFVETIAEEVAAALLQHPRVRTVRVSIRKLDVIEGEVGVEIRRDRASDSADVRPLSAPDRGA